MFFYYVETTPNFIWIANGIPTDGYVLSCVKSSCLEQYGTKQLKKPYLIQGEGYWTQSKLANKSYRLQYNRGLILKKCLTKATVIPHEIKYLIKQYG